MESKITKQVNKQNKTKLNSKIIEIILVVSREEGGWRVDKKREWDGD